MQLPISVVLVEDDDSHAKIVGRHLRKSEQMVDLRRASSLQEGVDDALRLAPEVMLLDLGLPDSQGLETLTSARLKLPDTPIVVLSASADQRLMVAALRAGAIDYLRKDQMNSHLLANAVARPRQRKASLRNVPALVNDIHSALLDPLTIILLQLDTIEKKTSGSPDDKQLDVPLNNIDFAVGRIVAILQTYFAHAQANATHGSQRDQQADAFGDSSLRLAQAYGELKAAIEPLADPAVVRNFERAMIKYAQAGLGLTN